MSVSRCAIIVSVASVVLPVEWSPTINSRWPRPSANSVSITRIPVCTGCVTRSRSMIEGAGRSIGHRSSASITPFPSSGRPSGSTMRPSNDFSHRHADHLARAEDRIARLDLGRGVNEDATDPVGIQNAGEPELAALEPQNLV
jgi:hypothetical protein